MKKNNQATMLKARVTHLEMQRCLTKHVPPPINMRLAIMRAYDMPVHFYRYLYALIGAKHHWYVRRNMTDEALLKIITSESTHIHILYVDGCPAGFAEVSLEKLPKSAEVVYFGLVPNYQGRGLSKFFLHEVLLSLWNNQPEKIIIQTNSLDNPIALQLYQKAGFIPVAYSDALVEAWQ